MLTGFVDRGEHDGVSSVTTQSPAGRAPRRHGPATAAQPRLLRQPGLTKRRFIDLMRVGRTRCC